MKKILYICCLFLFLKCATTQTCRNTRLIPVFIGFTKYERDTIIFRAYQPNGSFNQLVDTCFLNTGYVGLPHNDSLFVEVATTYTEKNKFPVMYPDHDWEIYLPARDTSIFISKIVSPQTTYKCWNCDCFNLIKSFVQDGTVVKPTYIDDPINLYPIGPVIYINKK